MNQAVLSHATLRRLSVLTVQIKAFSLRHCAVGIWMSSAQTAQVQALLMLVSSSVSTSYRVLLQSAAGSIPTLCPDAAE